MVNDMLDINKLEAGKMSFSYDVVNLTEVVKDSVDDMTDLLERK
jgi:signal transduction histidine kinase